MTKYRSEKDLLAIIADQAEQIMELRFWVELWRTKAMEEKKEEQNG